MQNKKSHKNPEQELDLAIKELSAFGQEPSLKKKVSLKNAMLDLFSANPFERLRSEKKIQKAVEVVRKYYPLIERFKEGTDKEKKLASFALDTIQKYNRHVEVRKETSTLKRAADFIFKKLGIEQSTSERKITLPVHATFSTVKNPSSLFCRITKKEESTPADCTKSEQDMFKMKAIMLLKQHNLSIKTIDAVSFQPQAQLMAENNIVSFGQLLKLLPGEEIELTGNFKRIPSNLKRSIPLVETFRLQATSHQTGYPHPMQRSGFAFTDSLLPSCPLRPENLPLFYKIHKKKEEAAIALLPKGRFNESAKTTLVYKGQAFLANKKKFLEMHRTLAESFLNLHEDRLHKGAIDSFFFKAKLAVDPYSFIASAYENFNTVFIKEAKENLYEKHILSKERTGKEDLTRGYTHFVNSKRESHKAEEFILFLSYYFERPILALFLQEISEIAQMQPPLLNDSDRIVQSVLFNQLTGFLEELEAPLESEEEAEILMEKNLVNDIELFSHRNQDLPLKLLDELEFYYLERHRERVANKNRKH